MGSYYDRNGAPMSLEDWCVKFEDLDYKVVEKTRVGDSEVSTVWLGLDHSFRGDPPQIFETMVFGSTPGDIDNPQWRYATEAEAREGHEEVVEAMRGGHDLEGL